MKLERIPSQTLRQELERRAAGEIANLLRATASVFGVRATQILSHDRGLRIDAARTAAMGILIELGHSPETIQRAFARGSLTTICKARRRWVEELSVSEPLRQKAAAIRSLVNELETRQ